MKNKVGREIPAEFLKDGKQVYQGAFAFDKKVYHKVDSKTEAVIDPNHNKVLPDLKAAIMACGLKDGMTVSFHHHFRDGDYVVCMVMQAIAELGIKDIMVCATSLGTAHDALVPLMESGVITGISSSGLRGKIGRAISDGKLKNVAYIRSHGGRAAAIASGAVHIDVAFIGAPTSDDYGNACGQGGISDCGVLSYGEVDARYADRVVIVTDTLVTFPNVPASISCSDVDYVVVVDKIGDSEKIANHTMRMTENPRELILAENAALIMKYTPYFKDGFSFQTGGGGPSLAVTRFLRPMLEEAGIKIGFTVGGCTKPMIDLLKDGFIGAIMDSQDFDFASVESVHKTPGHFEISTSEYADPFNKGAYVNRLDYVMLGALDIDIDFNVNVITGADGIVRGAPGGHVDAAAGSKCTVVMAPLVRKGRLSSVRDKVLTVTTPGETVDIFVTEVGYAVNPKRQDLLDALKTCPLKQYTIEELRDEAYALAGKPEEIKFEDKVVALVEYRDGTIIDVVRKPAKYVLA